MFEFIGFAVLCIICVVIFAGGLLTLYVAAAFGDRGTAIWGLFLVGLSVFGTYKVYNNSPYGIYVKSEQVSNDQRHTEINQKDK